MQAGSGRQVLRSPVAGPLLSGAAIALLTCPAVALAHLIASGSLPPVGTLVAVAGAAVLAGMLTARPAESPARLMARLTGAQLVGHLIVYVSLGEPANGCLPAMGRGAALGLRLAVLREDASCAPGQYAAGPVAVTAAAILLVAAALVLSQLLIAAGGSLLLRVAEHAWVSAMTLMVLVALVVGEFAALVITRVARPRPAHEPSPRPEPALAGSLLRRGPPRFAPA